MGLDQEKLGLDTAMEAYKDILRLRNKAAGEILPKFVTDSLARERLANIAKEAENSRVAGSLNS